MKASIENCGLTMDAQAIADGLYDLMGEDDRAVVAFGMVPLKWIKLAEKQFRWKAAKIALEKELNIKNPDPDFQTLAEQSVKQELVNDFTHRVSVALMKHAIV